MKLIHDVIMNGTDAGGSRKRKPGIQWPMKVCINSGRRSSSRSSVIIGVRIKSCGSVSDRWCDNGRLALLAGSTGLWGRAVFIAAYFTSEDAVLKLT